MNLIPSWLSHLRSRREIQTADTDLADMGTTFALEAAMPRLNELTRDELQGWRAEDPFAGWQGRPKRPAQL